MNSKTSSNKIDFLMEDKIETALYEGRGITVAIAKSDKGIAAISINDDPLDVGSEFEGYFPSSEMEQGSDHLERVAADVARLFEDTRSPDLGVTLDVRGTPLEHRVWDAIKQIPFGQTVTYRELAEGIDEPWMKVMLACTANRLPLIIPCHRAVWSTDEVGHWKWGADLKKRLIAKEAEASTSKGTNS